MKKIIFLLCIIILSNNLLLCSNEKDGIMTEGAVIGEWTMDYDAVVEKAAKEKIPYLINFTGSDWCGWCKLMDKNVFSTKEWKEYAKENIYLAFIDFPRNKSLVPAKYVQRNRQLSEKFGIRGYPTYILFDYDGTQLGTLGAGREKDGKSFSNEIKRILRRSKKNIEKLSEEKLKEYQVLLAQKTALEKELKEWIETKPERNEKNTKIYNSFQQKYEIIEQKIDTLFDDINTENKD